VATPDDDTQTQTPAPAAPPSSGGAPIDYAAIAQQLLQPPPQVQPDTTPAQGGWHGLLGRIGLALAGGTVTDNMSPAQKERAGIRALGDFGTSLMAGSGYYPGKPMFGGLAQGFQGAEQSERGSEEQVVGQLAARQNYQTDQQKLQMERLKAALPLLQMQQFAGARNLALGQGGATPGTATGSGGPATIAPPAVAYGQGGPGSTIPVPPEYMSYFQAASKRTGVPVDLLIAQARQESGFNPNAAGGGLMQIQDKTALNPGFGLTGVQSPAILKDPKTNIDFGADYLAARAKAAGADLSTPQGQAVALQAYNGGGDPDYVKNVTRYMPKPAAGPAPTVYAGPGVPPGGPAAPLPAPPSPAAPGGAPAVAPAAPGATTPPTVTPPPVTAPTTYTRQPLPPDIQARIDNPPIPPQYDTAVQTALTPEALQTAQNNKAAAIAAAKAKAIEEGETWQGKQQEIWQQNQTTAGTQQHEINMELLRNSEAQTNQLRNAQTTADQEQLKGYRADGDAAQQQVNTIQILRNVEKNMPESGSVLLQRHPELLDTLTNMGLPKEQADALSATDLFQRMLGFLGTQLSQRAAVGAGTARQAEIAQNMSVLPGLATDHNGRQQLMGFLLNLAQYRVNKANAAQSYYNTTTSPRFKDLPTLNGAVPFEQQYGDDPENAIVPQVPPNASQAWLDKHVKPGMLASVPVAQLDPITKQPQRDANGQPIYKYETQVRDR
jgi:soluble lytic murein transglycosylase-like protein